MKTNCELLLHFFQFLTWSSYRKLESICFLVFYIFMANNYQSGKTNYVRYSCIYFPEEKSFHNYMWKSIKCIQLQVYLN